ncbi:MAG: Ribosomal protein S11 [Candidatus Yanofskybacteria bacterium GW2011_GWC2_41_9]|uniref:Small ribosomal subunit protein uS11 n=1 Tax=Candidatus Yanofskybacteria bacterium GW2011_GWC2_41_9 TaxID=1619029 RepID=A0A0G0XRU9_9BACT|nr:MAG: Ribosomal protein S11 [Candidatus Yanofskybacteria bacterium GW2011_GWC2_41_9]
MGQKKIITKTDETKEKQETAPVSTAKSSVKKQVINGTAHISVSYNNIIIAISDLKGNIIAWSSAGGLGFKGARKSTPKNCVEKAKKYNLTNIKITVKGIGPGRESAVRGLAGTGLNIISIIDETPVAHNGVRKLKPRRV